MVIDRKIFNEANQCSNGLDPIQNIDNNSHEMSTLQIVDKVHMSQWIFDTLRSYLLHAWAWFADVRHFKEIHTTTAAFNRALLNPISPISISKSIYSTSLFLFIEKFRWGLRILNVLWQTNIRVNTHLYIGLGPSMSCHGQSLACSSKSRLMRLQSVLFSHNTTYV